MTEPRRSKASELADDLTRRELSDREWESRHPKVPELRLRADAPAIAIDEVTPVTDALKRLRGEAVGAMALRQADGHSTAVVIPVERYLELVGKELASGSRWVGTLDGQIVPVESAFAESYVEQVDPNETWTHDAIPGSSSEA